MHFGVITLFPEFVKSVANFGVIGRGFEKETLQLSCFNPRDFTLNKHGRVDDEPYGGGAGMIMQMQPLRDSIKHAKSQLPKAKVIYLSPQGKQLNQAKVSELSQAEELILLCGRYEGIDERAFAYIDEEISLGDYVISGGELAAMVLIDAVSRNITGVLGNEQSSQTDSFSFGLLDYPQYTRPALFDGMQVPQVLLSGDHEKIRQWRQEQAIQVTKKKRPELLEDKSFNSI